MKVMKDLLKNSEDRVKYQILDMCYKLDGSYSPERIMSMGKDEVKVVIRKETPLAAQEEPVKEHIKEPEYKPGKRTGKRK